MWIVGVDGSESSVRALRWAASFAAATGGQVQPVMAWEVPLPIWASQGRRAFEVDRQGLAASAGVAADRCVDDACDVEGDLAETLRGVIVEPMVVEGHPSRILHEWSESGYPVVVGRRGVSALRHRLLGSTSHYLVTHAAGPVVVVPETFDHLDPAAAMQVLVGFDASEPAIAALGWALETLPDTAKITALTAIDVVPWLQPEAVVVQYPDLVESTAAKVNEALDRIDPEGRAARDIVERPPYQTFADHFEGLDLIVVGPRGLGAVARTILGSVTTWLINEAPCPVVIVPAPDDT